MATTLKRIRVGVVLFGTLCLLCVCSDVFGVEYLVGNADEIRTAMSIAQPGDTLVMVNGLWMNQKIVFQGTGLEGSSILLQAETPGHVTLSGTSTLRIAGSYLVVDGLSFMNGYSSSGGVVEFRNGSSSPAHHCRLTQCAIVDYNPSSKSKDYKWISMYGSHNRVDHCYLRGKNHDAATLVVWLSSQPNYHLIDHNYFGYRPPLGYNGGETIRVGTSDWSMYDSYTTVEYNYFEHCNGEAEIISSKSCENIYRYNTFFECEGALTLRHGNRCTVEGNFFIGNQKEVTGGVRIIGEDHRVFNNYFSGLYGSSFKSALPIMNGVPNSPLNRYFQVKNAIVAFNTFVNCKYTMILGAGADSELSLPPENCIIANNLVLTDHQIITKEAEPSNLMWEGNIMQGASLGIQKPDGIILSDPQLILSDDELWRPSDTSPALCAAAGNYAYIIDDMDGQSRGESKDVGADQSSPDAILRRPLTASDVGPSWLSDENIPVSLAVTIEGSGDVILDPPGGVYTRGTVVTLTAVPDPGWAFDSWGGVLNSKNNPESVVMDENRGVMVTFKEETGITLVNIPQEYKLAQNYPNPFNPSTAISFSLKQSGMTTLQVYDMLGHPVAELINRYMEAGDYDYVFDASQIASGVYFYELHSGSFIQRKKMILIR